MTRTTLETPEEEARLDARAATLLLGWAAASAEETAAALGDAARVVRGAEAAHEILGRGDVAVLCLGAGLSGEGARTFLDEVYARHPGYQGCNVVLAAGPDPEVFAELVSADRVYYLTQKPPPPAEVLHILRSAAEHVHARRSRPPEDEDEEQALAIHRVLQITERLARQAGLAEAVARTEEAICELVAADRAAVLLYDPETDTLWNRRPEAGEERRESAAAGLVSYSVRTRAAVRLDRVGADPRYDGEADNDGGPVDERFLAVPVLERSTARVYAVAVALRAAGEPSFDGADQRQLEVLAEQIAPVLGRFLFRHELEERAARRHGVRGTEAGRIFREEALEHHARGVPDQGQLLQLSPGWTRWTYPLLLLLFAAAAVFALVGSIHEYAGGPAVVRLEGQTDVTAPLAGTVVSVEVAAGRRVAAGDLLARLYGVQEAAELDRASREFELGLAGRLRNPADPSAERTLGPLRAQKVQAERRLEERSVRAPHDGTVGDVWIQAGQHLTPGQVILSLDGGDPRLGIVALIPGHYRPLLRPGMPLRLELEGYGYAYQQLTVESVGDEVVGPAEARRFLGPGIGDAVPLTGSVVLVTARLPAPTFEADGRAYAYHHGTPGTAEVRVRSEKILFALVPALRALWGRNG